MKMLQLTLLLTASLLSLCVAEVFHVNATHPASPDQDCPQPCHTLDQYAQNTSLFAGHTNISLVFLDGVHHLNSILSISGNNGIFLHPKAEVLRSGNSSVVVRSQNDTIKILLYGQRIIVYKLVLESTDIQLGQRPIPILHDKISVVFATIRECHMLYGGIQIDTGKEVSEIPTKVANSHLKGNITGSVEVAQRNPQISAGIYANLSNTHNFTLVVYNTSITKYEYGIRAYSKGNTVAITKPIIFEKNKAGYFHELIIDKSTLFKNSFALQLANLSTAIVKDSKIYKNMLGVKVINCNITLKETEIAESNGQGIVLHSIDPEISHGFSYHNKVIFQNCVFTANRGSAILAYWSSFELAGENIFSSNTAVRGGGLALYFSKVNFGSLSKTTFTNNTAKKYGGAIFISSMQTRIPAILTDTFSKGYRQCFYAVPEVGRYPEIIFNDNNAVLGGMDIFGPVGLDRYPCNIINSSYFRFNKSISSTLQVTSNPLRVCFCDNNVQQCKNKTYLMLNETRYPGERFSISVVLVGYNFGQVSGPIYTETLDRYRGAVDDSQRIQSVHYKQCSNLTYTVTSNHTNHSVTLAMTAQEQITQEERLNNGLKNFLSICPKPMCEPSLNTPVYINVKLKDCPLGFKLDKTRRVCDCDEYLSKIRDNDQTVVMCEIKNREGHITRKKTVWIGVLGENNTDVYYWHRYCPRDYCKNSQMSIDINFPDKQCSSGRSGLLCGKCQTGYSLQLGGNKCIKCDNNYSLALLIVFAVLGILLVALIKLLNLTVTSATINGLIFYANVVWRNNAILFSLQDRQSIGYYVITVPIAWINLDFGIETCFNENLNQLTKTGLQFVFPVYIWCIAGLIIIISHYSPRATKLFGNNSVAVLATLFLLSFGKLFRNITDVFSYTEVPDSSGEIHNVWSLNGNIQYGATPGHIVLIVVALLFLILFLLPFTLTLLLVPFLRAKSHLPPFHWINTLMPFFDTYYGPFKDKKQHHVWTGILLISRVVIMIVNTSTSTSSPNANILLMILIATLLLMYSASAGLLYKKWYLSVLEMSYLVNLILLAGAFLFYQTLSMEDRQNYQLSPAAATSVCMALVQLIFTLTFHIAKQIIDLIRAKVIASKGYTKIETEDTNTIRKNTSRVTTQIVDIAPEEYTIIEREDTRESTPKVTTHVADFNNSNKVADYSALRGSLNTN